MAEHNEVILDWSLTNLATVAFMLFVIVIGWAIIKRFIGGFMSRKAPPKQSASQSGQDEGGEMQEAS